MIIEVCGKQGCGKSSLVASLVFNFLRRGYEERDLIANCMFPLFGGYRKVDNKGMIRFLREFVEKGERNKIIVCEEIDKVFAARLWSGKEQTETATNIWHMRKMGNQFIYTSHLGKVTDVIVRNEVNICYMPEYDERRNQLRVAVLDADYNEVGRCMLSNVSKYFNMFESYEPIV